MTEEAKNIRLLLVDDHTLMRETLRATLEREPDIEVVGEVGDGEAALAKLHELTPDLVLMDISMPGLSGIEITLKIVREHPGIKVLALSTYLERRFVAHMLNAGALGYISKTARVEELLLGVRTTMLGQANG